MKLGDWFGLLLFGAMVIAGIVLLVGSDSPRIGDNPVPTHLDCEEDEVIGYDPTDLSGPRPMTCIPYEKLENR